MLLIVHRLHARGLTSGTGTPTGPSSTRRPRRLGEDSLAFELAVPEAMPTGPARRGLLTGVRSFPVRNCVRQGAAARPGLDPIPDHQPIVTEVIGEAGHRDGLLHRQPVPRGSRFGNFRPHARLRRARADSQGAYRFPERSPSSAHAAPRSSIERYLLPELNNSWRSDGSAPDARVEQRSTATPATSDHPTARVVRSGINLVDDLKENSPFFLGVDCFDPHEPLDAPRVFQNKFGGPKGIETEQGITPIQPFETPYSWVIDVELDDDTIERVRELYAAEISFMDEWVGRLMNRLVDQKLLDDTVVIYSSDHGLTLGEHGIVGKHGSRAQWHIYHVPFMIRHPEGKLAGQWDDSSRPTTTSPARRCRSWARGRQG